MRNRTLIGAIAALAIIAFTGAGCASTDANQVSESGTPAAAGAPEKKKTFPVGATVDVSDSGNAARITIADLQQGQASEFADVKGELWQVTATIQGTKGTWEVNPLYFSAATNDGTHLEASLGGAAEQIGTASIPSGQKTSGAVAFDVPAGHTIQSISLTGPLGEPLATWTAR
ncbi:DUF1942 domain-containing protein [Gordonia soli]|uniref:MPT63-like domain-containing protein n=1 Tax=Gordonia soli NBRC 108243 TaxID=1223545 RepID=M0QPU2_9ACTN|nr:DUF1942 domain-containing protein [Gordonia soli]GAC70710.1 hypothetical protein GS4_39_00410 [Gordonia soli NBRC 108243]